MNCSDLKEKFGYEYFIIDSGPTKETIIDMIDGIIRVYDLPITKTHVDDYFEIGMTEKTSGTVYKFYEKLNGGY